MQIILINAYNVIFREWFLKFQMRLVNVNKFQGSIMESVGSVFHSSAIQNLNEGKCKNIDVSGEY